MKIYQIDSSARKKGSTSRELAKKVLDKIKTPVTKRVIPPIFEIKLIFFLKFLENNKNF